MALGRTSKSSSSSASSAADRFSTQLRSQVSSVAENKQCADCGQRGPTYVNITAASFVCTKCSGMLRGITPPHRIKSLSMSSFTSDEVEWMRGKGNVWSALVWTGLMDPKERKRRLEDASAQGDEAVKQFIIDKYEKKRYYVDQSSVAVSETAPVSVGTPVAKSATAAAMPRMIGSALTARMQQQQHGQESSKAIGRPGAGGSSSVTPPVTSNGHKPSASSSSGILADFGSSDLFSTPAAAASTVVPPQMPLSMSAGPLAAPPAQQQPAPAPAAAPANFAFANFDSANFDGPPANPLSPPKANRPVAAASLMPASTLQPAQPGGAQPAQSVAAAAPSAVAASDRYGALKDLDDLFKSSVTVDDAVPSSQSTGVSLFGSSPVQTAPVLPSQQQPTSTTASPFGDSNWGGGPAKPNAAPVPQQQPRGFGGDSNWGGGPAVPSTVPPPAAAVPLQAQQQQHGFGDSNWGGGPAAQAPAAAVQAPQHGFGDSSWGGGPAQPSVAPAAVQQPPQQHGFGDQSWGGGPAAPSVAPATTVQPPQQRGASPTDWAWKDQQQNGNGPTTVNPFTGATNLTQLNTSPWPTTGSSPINAAAAAAAGNGSGFAQWPQQAEQEKKPDPDPFATSNLQAESTDIFAKTQKSSPEEQPAQTDSGTNGNSATPTFDAFFETIASSAANEDENNKTNNNPWTANFNDNGNSGFAINNNNGGSPDKFTAAMRPAANPTNPFL